MLKKIKAFLVPNFMSLSFKHCLALIPVGGQDSQ